MNHSGFFQQIVNNMSTNWGTLQNNYNNKENVQYSIRADQDFFYYVWCYGNHKFKWPSEKIKGYLIKFTSNFCESFDLAFVQISLLMVKIYSLYHMETHLKIKLNVHVLAKTTWIIISVGPCIAKSLKKSNKFYLVWICIFQKNYAQNNTMHLRHRTVGTLV